MRKCELKHSLVYLEVIARQSGNHEKPASIPIINTLLRKYNTLLHVSLTPFNRHEAYIVLHGTKVTTFYILPK